MLEVEPEVASKIMARARERGMSVDVAEESAESVARNKLDPQERVRLLREWAANHNVNTPLLSDEAISRKSIYGERG